METQIQALGLLGEVLIEKEVVDIYRFCLLGLLPDRMSSDRRWKYNSICDIGHQIISPNRSSCWYKSFNHSGSQYESGSHVNAHQAKQPNEDVQSVSGSNQYTHPQSGIQFVLDDIFADDLYLQHGVRFEE
jgi:hypothetical protein